MHPAFLHAACQMSMLLAACSLQQAQIDTDLPWGLLPQGNIQAPRESIVYRQHVRHTCCSTQAAVTVDLAQLLAQVIVADHQARRLQQT